MGDNFNCYCIGLFGNYFAKLNECLVKVSEYSQASRPEVLWLPRVFRVDFQTVLAFFYSSIEGW